MDQPVSPRLAAALFDRASRMLDRLDIDLAKVTKIEWKDAPEGVTLRTHLFLEIDLGGTPWPFPTGSTEPLPDGRRKVSSTSGGVCFYAVVGATSPAIF